MNRNFLLSILLFSTFLGSRVHAQDLEFSKYNISSNVSFAGDITCHSIIKNLTASSMDLAWSRYWMDVTTDWQIAICDPNQCWTPEIESKPFTLAALDSGLLDIHFYSDLIEGFGWTQVDVFEVADPTNKVSNFYYGSEGFDFSVYTNNLSAQVKDDSALSISKFVNTDSLTHDYTFEWVADDIPSDFTATLTVKGQVLSSGTPITLSLNSGEIIDIEAGFEGDTSQFASIDVKVYRDDIPTKSKTLQFAATNYTSSSINSTQKAELNIFPNPATQLLYVEMNGFNEVYADIYDVLGRPIAHKIVSGFETGYISLDRLEAGLYFIQFTDSDNNDLGTQTFKKLAQ